MTTLIKVNYLRPLDRATVSISHVRLKIYVDDLQLDQEGSKENIIKHLPVAAATTVKVLMEELEADIAEDKAALIASNNGLAIALRAAIGRSAGLPALLAKTLGIDVTAGRARRTTAKKTLAGSCWARQPRQPSGSRGFASRHIPGRRGTSRPNLCPRALTEPRSQALTGVNCSGLQPPRQGRARPVPQFRNQS
jgi:hypothetical protein